jgi:hypothetical protein
MRLHDKAWDKVLNLNISHHEPFEPGSRISLQMGTYATAFHNQLQVNFVPLTSAADTDKVFVMPMVTRSQLSREQMSLSLGRDLGRDQPRGPRTPPSLQQDSPASSSKEEWPAEKGYTPASEFQPTKGVAEPGNARRRDREQGLD